MTAELPGATDVVAYNVLGAAPLYAEGVVYREHAGGETNPSVAYGGETIIVRDHVSYVFEPAPDSISMSGSSETRWRFDLAKGGIGSTIAMLSQAKKSARAAELAHKVALLSPDDEEAVERAEGFLGKAKPEALVAFTRELVTANPDRPRVARRTDSSMSRDVGRDPSEVSIERGLRRLLVRRSQALPDMDIPAGALHRAGRRKGQEQQHQRAGKAPGQHGPGHDGGSKNTPHRRRPIRGFFARAAAGLSAGGLNSRGSCPTIATWNTCDKLELLDAGARRSQPGSPSSAS